MKKQIRFNPAGWAEVQDISTGLGIPETEVIRKAILLMKLYSQLKQKGGSILISDDHEIRELIIT